MARQYLGCPSSSASVERLFPVVGICFADKRKKSTADTLSDRAFSKLNVERIYYVSSICAVTRGGAGEGALPLDVGA